MPAGQGADSLRGFGAEVDAGFGVVASGRAEFANGVRLFYPMEQEAMQFANLCANKAFGLIFSWLIGQPVKDTLCGTKVLFRRDYERMKAAGCTFCEEPREEAYGTVAVFQDLYGNKWDLLQRK